MLQRVVANNAKKEARHWYNRFDFSLKRMNDIPPKLYVWFYKSGMQPMCGFLAKKLR